MLDIKELTWEYHKNAERQDFVRLLLSGTIDEKLYAHVYVRHLGDLSGGQMIKRKTPGPNRYYIFKHGEAKEYKRIVKERVESYLNVYEINVLPEAIFCFESATKLFKEMYDLGKTY